MTTSSHGLRIAGFWLFVIACVAGTMAYVRLRTGSAATASAPEVLLFNPVDAAVAAKLGDVRTAPHVMFLSTLAEAMGQIGVAPIASPGSQTLFQSEACERAYFTRSQGLCLVLNRISIQPRAFAYFLDRRFQTL